MIHHFKRATRHLIFWSLLSVAIGLTCLRLLLSGIEGYKADLSDHVSELLGAPVSIGRIGAKMRGFSPELILKDISVQSVTANGKPPIQLQEIRLGTNLFSMVRKRELWSSAWLTLIGAKLSIIRNPDGNIVIDGLGNGDSSPQWLLQGEKLAMVNSEIIWHDQKGQLKPLLLNTVDLVIKNAGQQHQLNLVAQLPKQYGDSVRVSMNLTGNGLDTSALKGQAYLEGKLLQLGELIPQELLQGIRISSGKADVKVWSDWQQAQPVQVTVAAQLQQGEFVRRDKSMYIAKKLSTRFRWRQSAQRWYLQMDEFTLATSTKNWPNSQFSLSVFNTAEHSLSQLGLFAIHVDLQELDELLQFFVPLPDAQLKLLADRQLKGVLQNMSIFADIQKKSGAINGQFNNISIAAAGDMPGVNNLSGAIKGDEQKGGIHFATEKAQLIALKLFRTPLTISRLAGILGWQQTPESWIFSGKDLLADVPGLFSTTQVQLDIPKSDGTPVIDLQSSFSSPDMSKAPLYLPVGVMSKSLVNWLDHAFIGGRISKGEFLLRGELDKFPFKNSPGIFKVLFDTEQLELTFHPDWPHLTNLAGSVSFLKNGVQIDLRQGQSGEVKINQASISISEMGDNAKLLVKGQGESDLGQGLAFLEKTPLQTKVEPVLAAIAPQGLSKVALNLTIPLVDNSEPKAEVVAELNQAKMKVNALDLWVNHINGAIKFNRIGVFSDAIHATALGQSVKIAIGQEQKKTVVNVDGSAEIADLQKQFKLPWWDVAKGAAEYRLKLALPDKASAPMQLDVQSDLVGVVLDLPGDLAKVESQRRSLALSFDLNQKAFLPINLNYDNKLKAALKFNLAGQRIEAGHLVIGEGKAQLHDATGLTIDIKRDRLALQDWLGLAAAQNNYSFADRPIRKLSIHSPHALWKNTDLGSFELMITPEENHWLGELDSSFATGKIHIPTQRNDTEKITVTLQKLDLSALRQLKSHSTTQGSTISPDAMPLFSLSSAKALWQQHDLGMLVVETERIPTGIVFKHIDIFGNDQKLSATGEWKSSGNNSVTQMQGRLEMPQAGSMLANLGITNDISEANGTADFLLNWRGAPYELSLADLKGQLTVNLNRGRILSIEPGFGRILGVLALAQWINRLQLDFSDIYQEGLTFNSIKGRFDLLNGKAVTQNLVVDAVPAKITLTGETNLVLKTVDQVVNVAPKSADAVPIAGTIMGKITAFMAKSLTGKDQEGFFFGSQYLIKGVWGNVQIIPLHENDGLMQKTWNSITTFPWLQQQETKK